MKKNLISWKIGKFNLLKNFQQNLKREKLLEIFEQLVIDLFPIFGLFALNWDFSSFLLVFWFDGLIQGILATIQILLTKKGPKNSIQIIKRRYKTKSAVLFAFMPVYFLGLVMSFIFFTLFYDVYKYFNQVLTFSLISFVFQFLFFFSRKKVLTGNFYKQPEKIVIGVTTRYYTVLLSSIIISAFFLGFSGNIILFACFFTVIKIFVNLATLHLR